LKSIPNPFGDRHNKMVSNCSPEEKD